MIRWCSAGIDCSWPPIRVASGTLEEVREKKIPPAMAKSNCYGCSTVAACWIREHKFRQNCWKSCLQMHQEKSNFNFLHWSSKSLSWDCHAILFITSFFSSQLAPYYLPLSLFSLTYLYFLALLRFSVMPVSAALVSAISFYSGCSGSNKCQSKAWIGCPIGW